MVFEACLVELSRMQDENKTLREVLESAKSRVEECTANTAKREKQWQYDYYRSLYLINEKVLRGKEEASKLVNAFAQRIEALEIIAKSKENEREELRAEKRALEAQVGRLQRSYEVVKGCLEEVEGECEKAKRKSQAHRTESEAYREKVRELEGAVERLRQELTNMVMDDSLKGLLSDEKEKAY